MKVVLVSSFPAFPTTAGNRSRIRQLAASVKELGHDLTFVYLESKWESCDDGAHEAAFGRDGYIRIRKQHWGWKRTRELARGAVRRALRVAGFEAGCYSPLDRFRDRDFLAALEGLGLRPDVVIVEYVLDSWAFEAFPPTTRRVLDTHDAFADRHKAYLARGIQDYWVSFRPHVENRGLRRAQVVLAIQQEEARRFRGQLASDGRKGDPEVAVVGHLLQFDGGAVDPAVDGAAVFVASDNPANRDALHSFVRHVLPDVVRDLPGFTLKLAGSICGAVGDLPHVAKLGWVDDLRTVFSHAPLSVNPMLAGTGINIKLLDAMAAGVPTVSTATGARGLPDDLKSGVCVVPDEDPRAFAAATVRLATDAGARRAMGAAALADARVWHARQLEELQRCLADGRA